MSAARSTPPPPPQRAIRPPARAASTEMLTELRAREASSLVDKARTGDPRAFDVLVRRYRPRIFALALHMTGSPSDADDITQDAFLRAFRKIREFEGRSEFFTWLYRIALHRALNVKRDRGRRATTALDDPRVTLAVTVDAEGDPLLALELRETYALLVRAFDLLSPSLRTTLVLTTLQGLSYKEAAVVLATNEGTIAWRVHEARAQIQRTIQSLAKDPTPVPARRRRVTPEEAERARGLSMELALSLLTPGT